MTAQTRRLLRGVTVTGALLGSAAFLLSQQGFNLPPAPKDDVLLRAMHDEMERVPQLALVGGKDSPYFVSFTISDADSVNVTSMLGATIAANRHSFRSPSVEVRLGSYEYDNTGHVNSGAYTGTRLDGDWPLDANYLSLRNSLWLTADRAFKTALESISRKRSSQNNAAPDKDPLPNFSKVEPVVDVQKVTFEKLDQGPWEARANRLSSVFKRYPDVLTSELELQAMTGMTTMLTSEGTMIRYEDGIGWVYGKAESQASDGMIVHDAATLQSLTLRTMPAEADMSRALTEVAENVRALAKAPAGEAYTGPVLFEPRAAAQLLAQVLGDNLRLVRRPLTNPGQNVNITPSELETRVNARVLPAFFDVFDDPTLRTYENKPLVGTYEYDLEGVKPQRVSIIEKGVFKNFLTTRTPARNFPASNGHARLPGNFGARAAALGNLFVKANESMPLADMKRQLISMITQLDKPYGILVRKLDFPYSGPTNELQAIVQANAQGGGAPRPLSPPVLAYRVYRDGHEELVRGLRFHGFSARSLRDVLAASQETAVFEYVNTSTLMALLGSGGYLAPTSVISPGLLFEEIEFETPREQFVKPPTVPPPAMQP